MNPEPNVPEKRSLPASTVGLVLSRPIGAVAVLLACEGAFVIVLAFWLVIDAAWSLRLALSAQAVALILSFLAAYNSQVKIDRENAALARLAEYEDQARRAGDQGFILAKDEDGKVLVVNRVTALDRWLPSLVLGTGAFWLLINALRAVRVL